VRELLEGQPHLDYRAFGISHADDATVRRAVAPGAAHRANDARPASTGCPLRAGWRRAMSSVPAEPVTWSRTSMSIKTVVVALGAIVSALAPALPGQSVADSQLIAHGFEVRGSALPHRGVYKHPGRVTQQYDAVRDVTSLHARFLNVGPNLNLSAFAAFRGKAPKVVPLSILLDFGSQSADWRFLRVHDVDLLLADNTRLHYDGDHDGEVVDGGVAESISIAMPVFDALKLVKAGRAVGELGGVQFKISPDKVDAIADLLSRLAPGQ